MGEAEKAIRCPPGEKGLAYAPKGILLKLADAMDVGHLVRQTDTKREVRRVIERHIRYGAYTDEKVYSLLLEVGYCRDYRDKGEEGQAT